MIEKVIDRRNLRLAAQHVKANKGSAGVDGMGVTALSGYLKTNRDKLCADLVLGRYRPQPILGVEIPKSNGKTRLLGIPTVIDRMLQEAVSQVIMIRFETEFRPHSYGFRPNRNAQQAVQKAQAYINEGYQHIADINLKNAQTEPQNHHLENHTNTFFRTCTAAENHSTGLAQLLPYGKYPGQTPGD